MSLIEHYRVCCRYNRWMNDRLLACCAQLTNEQRNRDLGAFFGSIHNTFNHLLIADRAWLGRLTSDPERFASRDETGAIIEIRSLGQVIYPDFQEFCRQRSATDSDLRAFVDELDNERIASTMRYAYPGGKRYEHPTWWVLSHVFNHHSHHRGQITTLLSQLGIDPGVTDLAAMLRDDLR